MNELLEIQNAMRALLRERFSETVYDIFFKELELRAVDPEKHHALLYIANRFKCDMIATSHRAAVKEVLSAVLGFAIKDIDVDYDEINHVEFRVIAPEVLAHDRKIEELQYHTSKHIEGRSIVNEYTFENFIVGDSNKFAHAACVAVAKSPTTYNPLFIHGPSGLGKTHLLYAVTNELKRSDPDIRLIYKKGEEFTNELIEAIKNGSTVDFREKYRRTDVLLIDDIQFIAGKQAIQEEFFHTFNALYESERQIILTSDRPPREIKTLEERLSTRFEWGLIADIQPPSFELRTAIIKKKAEDRNVPLTPDVINYLAENLKSNIRQIEGAIKKLEAISVLSGTRISLEMTKRSISDVVTDDEPVYAVVEKILRETARKYGVSVEDIKGKKRTTPIANARHICIYLMHTITSMPLTAIGEMLNRDHATVHASIKKIKTDIQHDKRLVGEMAEIAERVKK